MGLMKWRKRIRPLVPPRPDLTPRQRARARMRDLALSDPRISYYLHKADAEKWAALWDED